MNRITIAIERMKLQIQERIASGITTAEKVKQSCKDLDISFEEYFLFQENKSLAQIHGLLSLEEALTIYNYLGGGGPDKFNSSPVEVKSVLTNVFSSLLQWKIAGCPTPKQKR